jgi:hypothetical protein
MSRVMDKPDHAFFKDELQHFATVHRVTLGPTLLAAYWTDLKDMPRVDFDRACKKLRRDAPWFPKPTEFRAAGKPVWL